MTRQRIIRPILAGIMLALFALSITPRILVHALAANHQDTHNPVNQDKATQLNKAGFHCNVDNNVVEVPFLSFPLTIRLEMIEPTGVRNKSPEHSFHSSDPLLFGLRGPPAFL